MGFNYESVNKWFDDTLAVAEPLYENFHVLVAKAWRLFGPPLALLAILVSVVFCLAMVAGMIYLFVDAVVPAIKKDLREQRELKRRAERTSSQSKED